MNLYAERMKARLGLDMDRRTRYLYRRWYHLRDEVGPVAAAFLLCLGAGVLAIASVALGIEIDRVLKVILR